MLRAFVVSLAYHRFRSTCLIIPKLARQRKIRPVEIRQRKIKDYHPQMNVDRRHTSENDIRLTHICKVRCGENQILLSHDLKQPEVAGNLSDGGLD